MASGVTVCRLVEMFDLKPSEFLYMDVAGASSEYTAPVREVLMSSHAELLVDEFRYMDEWPCMDGGCKRRFYIQCHSKEVKHG